jgi:hypothetical protein
LRRDRVSFLLLLSKIFNLGGVWAFGQENRILWALQCVY